jgi:hypothetical protein
VLKGFILAEEHDFRGAIAVYAALPESALAVNNKAKPLISLDESADTIGRAAELFARSGRNHYSIGLLNAASAATALSVSRFEKTNLHKRSNIWDFSRSSPRPSVPWRFAFLSRAQGLHSCGGA